MFLLKFSCILLYNSIYIILWLSNEQILPNILKGKQKQQKMETYGPQKMNQIYPQNLIQNVPQNSQHNVL